MFALMIISIFGGCILAFSKNFSFRDALVKGKKKRGKKRRGRGLSNFLRDNAEAAIFAARSGWT
jgi:hypothetical protein